VAANVPEVLKTRLQLQGELQRADSNAPKVYKSVLDVFKKTWRMEGIKGLQRGLLPAVSSRPRAAICRWLMAADSVVWLSDPAQWVQTGVLRTDPSVLNIRCRAESE
jgi:hypothetical protein